MIQDFKAPDLELGKSSIVSGTNHHAMAFGSNKVNSESVRQMDSDLVIPPFTEESKDEFLVATFQPHAFRAVVWLVSIFISCTILIILADGHDGYNGSRAIFYWTWAPYILCCAVYLLLAAIFSLESCRPFCIRHYDALCALSILLLYLTCVSTYVILEIRAAAYGSADYPHIVRVINFSAGFPPARSCVDTDPDRTWATAPRILAFSGGTCSNLVLSGASFTLYVLLNVLPMVSPAGRTSTPPKDNQREII